ncbi:MAG: type II toxin-antitoxin system VapC family toxin [Candidatus Bipolaricaulota bacterium]
MILYLDTSALLKLYAEERGTSDIRAAVTRASVVTTSRLTYVEARGAFARKVRQGELSPAEHQYLASSLEEDWGRFLVVELSDNLCQEAVVLVERHPLRAGDALQLASACTVKHRVKEELVFSSFDERLNRAAEAEKLPVL